MKVEFRLSIHRNYEKESEDHEFWALFSKRMDIDSLNEVLIKISTHGLVEISAWWDAMITETKQFDIKTEDIGLIVFLDEYKPHNDKIKTMLFHEKFMTLIKKGWSLLDWAGFDIKLEKSKEDENH